MADRHTAYVYRVCAHCRNTCLTGSPSADPGRRRTCTTGFRTTTGWYAAAADVDVVAITGDLADVVNPVPTGVQTVVLDEVPRAASPSGPRVLVASGNHDLDGPGADGEQVAGWLRRPTTDRVHADGASVDIDGTRFTVCPWWDGPITRDEVGAQLAAAAVDRPARWVWLYHAPPAGTRCAATGGGSSPTTTWPRWIAEHQPDIVLCGHIHQAPWVDGGSWHARLGEHAGSSTPASRSARCRRTSPSTPRPGRRTGSASSSRRRSASPDRACVSDARGRPRGRGPSPVRGARPGGGPGCRGSGRPSRGGRRRRRTAA